ncbi:Hypothetical predicted protein [Pelobates cultripes]|uniref:Uncharacterized protein n=1 Tax=Pelobates cultripes TaxID=61616 RepID=A0AAD1STB4_PELCU|nr:Hypothetical predicted protein [Pelobates cultripes]
MPTDRRILTLPQRDLRPRQTTANQTTHLRTSDRGNSWNSPPMLLMINKQISKSNIAQVLNHRGWVQRLPDAITTMACSYYENLYSTETAGNHPRPKRKTEAIHAYLEANIHTTLTEDAKRTLEAPLTLEELTPYLRRHRSEQEDYRNKAAPAEHNMNLEIQAFPRICLLGLLKDFELSYPLPVLKMDFIHLRGL